MSEKQEDKDTEVSLTPEKVESLKEEHGVTDEVIEEIVQNVEVTSKPTATVRSKEAKAVDEESGFLRAMSKGDLGTGEALMVMDFLDRKERQRIRDEKKENEPKHSRIEEKPDWAKNIEKSNLEILDRLKREEEAKKTQKLLKEATDPLKADLQKKDERTTRLEEKIEKLEEPPKEKIDLGKVIGASVAVGVATALKDAGIGATPPPRNYVDDYIESRDKLKAVGLLKDGQKSNILLGPGGTQIPIKGEIPAALAYGPTLAKDILTAIEDTADRIGKKYGLIEGEKPSKPAAPLIKMPPKPATKPVEPVTEAVTIIEPETPIITMPEKPAEAVTKPVTIKKPEVKEAPTPKGYTCKYCGTSGFEKPWQLAQHSKKCPEAIKTRKKKEKKPDEQTTKKSQ